MKTSLVVTVTCPDRPGIVERLTEVIGAADANWEESRMARLGGDFAGIVRISVAADRAEALAAALRGLAGDQMTVVVKASQPAAPDTRAGYALCDLRLTGADHEGIVHKVAAYLAGQGINVESMETDVVNAPVSAAPLFQMAAQIKVPPELSLNELSVQLDRIAEELGVDVIVQPIPGSGPAGTWPRLSETRRPVSERPGHVSLRSAGLPTPPKPPTAGLPRGFVAAPHSCGAGLIPVLASGFFTSAGPSSFSSWVPSSCPRAFSDTTFPSGPTRIICGTAKIP